MTRKAPRHPPEGTAKPEPPKAPPRSATPPEPPGAARELGPSDLFVDDASGFRVAVTPAQAQLLVQLFNSGQVALSRAAFQQLEPLLAVLERNVSMSENNEENGDGRDLAS